MSLILFSQSSKLYLKTILCADFLDFSYVGLDMDVVRYHAVIPRFFLYNFCNMILLVRKKHLCCLEENSIIIIIMKRESNRFMLDPFIYLKYTFLATL